MARIEERIDVAASKTAVFKWCHDPEQRLRWDERWDAVEVLTGPPLRTGTLVRVDSCHAGWPVFSWEGEYVEFQFPRGSRLRVIDAAPSSPFQSGSEKLGFETIGEETRVTLVWEYSPGGVIARILDALARRSVMRRAIRQSLKNLKEMAEGAET